ncbi:hypothetical protein SAMN04489760_10363 [Syntrophus gentianae]|uniref:Uncharacterized protein n=1 Tax=Syntrophus gentianae TaxID=43775 RepID=A0A1H7V7T6_9BACT|nr:hypothetical protein [Syntrophus gentianae]SEM04905.1 hypothetical protein SAMN04489760_10363 [Syntrophus gentianae]
MSKTEKLITVAVALWICIVLAGSPAFGKTIQKPVVYSYYWPIGEGQKDLLKWNMESPNVIDVVWQDTPQWLEAKAYWEKRGKTILYRVRHFREINTEEEMYDAFKRYMENSKGIAIDEIVTHKLPKERAKMFTNALRRIRAAYPDKIIAVWCSGNWDTDNSFVLKAIRDYADMFLPEIYIPQRTAERKGLGEFKRYLKDAEELAPGITKKTVVGIGLHAKMANDTSPSQSFSEHISAQIALLGTEPFFRNILGVALYAPVYMPAQDQKAVDGALKKYFRR